MVRKGAGQRVLEIDGIPLPTEEILLSYTDITAIAQAEENMQTLANHDQLTQLPNRRLLLDRIAQAIAGCKRTKRYAAIMLLDLERFKPLNDRYGHQAGDILLVEVANRLKKTVRDIDTVARIGGDEFVVLLTGLNAKETEAIASATAVGEKILHAIGAAYVIEVPSAQGAESVEHHCTCSIGISTFVDHQADADRILKCADTAMYRAKSRGRNQIYVYDDAETAVN